MKSIISLLICWVMIFTLCACNPPDFQNTNGTHVPETDNLLFEGEYEYCSSSVVYEGEKRIITNEKKRRRVYYMPCEPETQYSMQCFINDTVVFLASAENKPEECIEADSLTAIMSNRVAGKAIERIMTVMTGKNDRYLIFAFNINELSMVLGEDDIDNVYGMYLNKTVIKKGNAFSIKGDPTKTYFHDPYYSSEYAQNALKKLLLFSEYQWTPRADMPSMNGIFPSDTTQKGLPYSSVKGYNKFVGIDVLLETYATCLENPNGILYRYKCGEVAINNYSSAFDGELKKNICTLNGKIYKRVGQQNASCYYGTVCSTIVCYAIGIPFYETTYSFANKDVTELPLDLNEMRSGDVVIQYRSENGGGHTVIILDIERDLAGEVKYITYGESNYSNCHVSRVTDDEFVLRFLKESPMNSYSIAKVYRYNNFEKNVIGEYDKGAISVKDGKSVLQLEDCPERVGCVFIDGNEYFDYTYDPSTGELVLDSDLLSIGDSVIMVSRYDMDRSYLASAESYNYGNGAIALDYGNKSVYSVLEDIEITLFDDKGAECVEILREGSVIKEYGLDYSVDIKNGTHTVRIKKGELEGGYYTARAVDQKGNSLGTQEFMVYGDATAVISNGYSQDGVIIPDEGMIKGRISSHDSCITPMYVSRVGVTGIVYDTSPINADGSFEISLSEDPAGSYLKFHYSCNYGRVATPAYQVYYGETCN